MSLFLTILTVLKCTGQVVHRRSLDWDLPSIFPQWDWSYRLLGERPQRESVILIISHHVEESCYASNVIYQCCCWPRSSGRGRLLGFSALRVTLLAPFLLSFCKEVKIPHYYCEVKLLIQLACSDNFLNDLVMYFATGLLAGGPLSGILYSYSKIVSSIYGISSAQGKLKAFSTCVSHLSVVSLFYCTSLGVYLSSSATQSSHSSEIALVMYTVVTSMLNPFIYSLRNKDIKMALKAFFRMTTIKMPIAPSWRREREWNV